MPRKKGTGEKIPLILMILKRLGKATAREILDNGLGHTGTNLKNARNFINRAVGYGMINKVSATEYMVNEEYEDDSDELGNIDFHGRVKDTSTYPKQDPHYLSQIWR